MLLNLKIFWSQLPEKFWFWWAWRLPKKLVYFATIRLVAFATQGEYGNTVVSELPAMEAIGRWERGLTKRAVDETICTCSHDAYENVVNPGHCMACGKPFRR